VQGELELIDHDHYFTHLAWLDCDHPHSKPTIAVRGQWLWHGAVQIVLSQRSESLVSDDRSLICSRKSLRRREAG
jgi:hypothetical protein